MSRSKGKFKTWDSIRMGLSLTHTQRLKWDKLLGKIVHGVSQSFKPLGSPCSQFGRNRGRPKGLNGPVWQRRRERKTLDFVLLCHLKGHLTKSPNLSRPQFPHLSNWKFGACVPPTIVVRIKCDYMLAWHKVQSFLKISGSIQEIYCSLLASLLLNEDGWGRPEITNE